MGNINLYKIAEDKKRLFLQGLSSVNSVYTKITLDRKDKDGYKFTLFYYMGQKKEQLSWEWLFKAFGVGVEYVGQYPKAILVAVKSKEMYAIVFGRAYFDVNIFCELNWGLSIAKRVDFNKIKLTSMINPDSKCRKTVNAYVNNNALYYNSAESFKKVKAEICLGKNEQLLRPTMEFGDAISLFVKFDSIDSIITAIEYIKTLSHNSEKHEIPLFEAITNKTFVKKLNEQLKNELNNENAYVDICEINVIGSSINFRKEALIYKLFYRNKEYEVQALTMTALQEFCKKRKIKFGNFCVTAKIVEINEGQIIDKKLLDCIDYTNQEKQCILSEGKWYRFNSDYIKYLAKSLSMIEHLYETRFDITEKDIADYNKRHTKKKYAEYIFNCLRQKDGFKNLDRSVKELKGHKYEVADLYNPKDKELIAVKIGKSSEKFCYVVDQSLIMLRMLKDGKIKYDVNTITIWLILEGHTEMREKSSSDVNLLKMIALKNKIDDWRKQVVLAGYRPKIRMNYRY